MKKFSREEWIDRFNKVHNYKFTYDDVPEDILSGDKITIRCVMHGDFKQKVNDHVRGLVGCLQCRSLKMSKRKMKKMDIFISELYKIYKDEISVKNINEYKGTNILMSFICKVHGEFQQTPKLILNGSGCKKCKSDKVWTHEDFIIKAKKVHGDNKYIYKSIYKNARSLMLICCIKHGDFKQKANTHLNGHGCPKCKQSKGEIKISNWLIDHNFHFIYQHKFNNCRGKKRPLPFDFYLPELNICIEYDGEQHYHPIDRFGGNQYFKLIKNNDQIKDSFCERMGVKLLRISYKEDVNKKLTILI